ncbi:MAG: hypothetical protein HQK54_04515 [Oligoflexales bacterium]|nr:hypothetical protein [Oligoflexales bacterium]
MKNDKAKRQWKITLKAFMFSAFCCCILGASAALAASNESNNANNAGNTSGNSAGNVKERPESSPAESKSSPPEKQKPSSFETAKNEKDSASADAASKEENKELDEKLASTGAVRQFHEVLDELLSEFSYDVKKGQVNGLKNLSVRKVIVDNTLPVSYKSYLEMLVTERIRENSRIRLITCLPCKTKTSRIVDGKFLITSPQTNMAEATRAAEQLGIENFMDVVLIYHTTHMVLAFNIFNTETKEAVWARTYNSETTKSRYQKLAVDFNQIEKSKNSSEYVPEYRFMGGMGVATVPNVGGTSEDKSFLALQFRGMEKFNNRKNEFGLLLSYWQNTKTLTSSYPTENGSSGTASATTTATSSTTDTSEPVPKPFTSAIGLYAVFAYNFLGALESYNEIRTGLNLGVGLFLATGYLATSGRLGLDTFLGKKFTISLGGLYIAPSQILMAKQFVKTKGGSGGDLVISYNF